MGGAADDLWGGRLLVVTCGGEAASDLWEGEAAGDLWEWVGSC